MTFGPRLIVVALAAFGVAGTLTSVIVGWWTSRVTLGTGGRVPALFQLRLAPAVMSVAALLLATASFERFEPRGGDERTGLMLTCCAVLAGATLLTMAARLARLARASNRALTAWMRSASAIRLPGVTVPAYRIDAAFPIVAIAGVFRPRLLIASSVLRACPPDEIEAILAHEAWHVRHRDNLRRLLMAATPDVLMWLPLSRRLAAAWQSAAEDAADAQAAMTRPGNAVSLAQALVRLGRMTPVSATPAELPASALFRGENLERRIRRLLDPPEDFGREREPRWWVAAAAVLLVAGVLALYPIHELMEAAVAFLP